MRRPLALALALALTGASACAAVAPVPAAAPASPLVGQPFAIAVPDLAGREIRVPDVSGRVWVVDFWASWCDPCREQFPVLEALAARHGPAGLSVVGVSFDEGREAVEAFLAETKVSFPVLWDPGGARLSDPLRVDRLPTTFVVDRRGVVRGVHLGHDQAGADALEAEVVRLLAEGS